MGGKSYQVPWYQAIAIELINTQIYTGTPQGTDPETYAGGADLKVEDFPKTFDGIPALCRTIVDKTGKLCNMRLTVNNLLADMVYQGGSKVVADDGSAFTFNDANGVAWLQMYVDLVANGLVDKESLTTADGRIALDKFIQGESVLPDRPAADPRGPLEESRPLRLPRGGAATARQVRRDRPDVDGDVGEGRHEVPEASLALATFFTNPQSMLEFSKIVGIYPSTPASYEDPFFTEAPVAIEVRAPDRRRDHLDPAGSDARAAGRGVASADVNQVVLKHVQEALFNGVPAQEALDAAVEEANALIQ